MHENLERDPPTENLPSVDQILEKHGRVIEEKKGGPAKQKHSNVKVRDTCYHFLINQVP